MPASTPRGWRRHALTLSFSAALAAVASHPAAAQPPQTPAPPVWARGRDQGPPQQQQAAPPAPPSSPVVARVGGREITQLEFDRVAQPYFQNLKAQFGPGFDAAMQKMASFHVLDELVRRDLLAIEAQRQKIAVSEQETDAILQADPFFLTDGRFDPVKFSSYKTNPASNYLVVLPQLREAAASQKLELSLRKRFTPTPAQVRAEWAKRMDQVRFQLFPLLTRDMPLDSEATAAEWAAYYQAHPDQFMRATRLRLRYLRLPLPSVGDTTRAAQEAKALARARGLADSLRSGALRDSAAELTDTGLFDLTSPIIPGLGRVAGLSDSVARADQDSTLRVLGPFTTPDGVIVGTIAERQPRHLPPMQEVIAEVKRRADAEKRRLDGEAERLAFYQAHPERWRVPRALLTRVTLNPTALTVHEPATPEVDRWYAQHGQTLFGAADAKAWLPPITDSLRAVARTRLVEEQRAQRVSEILGRLAAALRTTRDARAPARGSGAVAETLSLFQGMSRDSLFAAPLLDSLLAPAALLAARDRVQGPRRFGQHWALWRVDAADTAFVAPFAVARSQVEAAFGDDRRRKDEAEGRAWFEQHRASYRTPTRYALDAIAVRIPPPDSVRVSEAELRRRYSANPKSYRQEEEVKARHILFMTEGGDAAVEKRAKARADSLLAAIRRDGGDFGELARRFSEEPGASSSGGELGWFGRGRMVKPFEEAVFALKAGEISPVVKTQFGYHIIQVEERKAPGLKPFDAVRAEIRAQMASARGDSSARRAANVLRRSLGMGGDVRQLATPYGGVVAAAPIAAEEAVPAIGLVSGLPQELPSMAVGPWSKTVYRAGSSYVVLRLRDKLPPHPAEFDEVKARAIEDAKNDKRRALLARKVGAIRTALSAGAAADSLAAPLGGFRDSGFQGRSGGFLPGIGNEPRVVQKAFTLKPSELTDTLEVSQGVVWLRGVERKSGDPAAFKVASAQIEAELMKKKYDAWLEERKKAIRIEILRPDLKGPRPVTMAMSGG